MAVARRRTVPTIKAQIQDALTVLRASIEQSNPDVGMAA
jgi:hypothetical protein